jgi:hypothetical protein
MIILTTYTANLSARIGLPRVRQALWQDMAEKREARMAHRVDTPYRD